MSIEFKVPIIKDEEFSIQLFKLFSYSIDNCFMNTSKIPDKITFNGKLAKEILEFIIEKKWNFNKFKIDYIDNDVNMIIFSYSNEKYNEESNEYISSNKLSNIVLNSIPNKEIIDSFLRNYVNFSYSIKRPIYFKYQINLYRKND